ncbi:MAG TPA: RNA polymerase sigma factor [Acidimicrobiia bacterium]|jgi:RNA polymerase sigma-70 factor (ECF subfamily)|nr:RNA polymerase sigma factor [Acidimicrobiia bacterium]
MRASGDSTFADALAIAAEPGPDRSAAYEHLLRPLLFPVRRYLQAQAREAADDLVDEVLLAVFEHLPRFEGTESQFRSWVFTIAHHRVVDHHRRRRLTVPLDQVTHWRAPDDPEADALARVGAHALRGALAALAPGQREVLLLRIVDDLSIEQTAARLGRSPGAVKALQHRAIEAVRLRIQASGHPPGS